uniref:SGNH_hydro domain-containing protein n=1 Tax=Meloidogyne hapla TaxID=6305 RepID=A0A1I8C1C0_MELHA
MLIYPNWQFFVKNLFKFVCIASILPFTKPNCLHEDGMQEKNANGYFEHYPSEGQETVSKYMNKYQNNQKIDLFGDNHLFSPKFVMSLGDNFYDNGIGPGEAEDRFGKVGQIIRNIG